MYKIELAPQNLLLELLLPAAEQGSRNVRMSRPDPAPAPCAGEQLALFVGAPAEDKDPPGSVLTGTLAVAREGGDSSSHAPGAVPLAYLCAQPGCACAVDAGCASQQMPLLYVTDCAGRQASGTPGTGSDKVGNDGPSSRLAVHVLSTREDCWSMIKHGGSSFGMLQR